MIGIGRSSSHLVGLCRSQLFFRNNACLSFPKALKASVLKTPTMLKLSAPSLRQTNGRRFFTETGLLKHRWASYFAGESANRYVSLNRFQQYQESGSNPNSLFKVTLFGLALMTGIYFLSPYLFAYVPPFTYFRRNPKELVYALLGINVAVFGLWQVPRYWRFLQKYMLLEKRSIQSKWSLVGSAFSHQEFWHLGMNMLALWSFGTSLSYMIGASNFFSMYMNCAIAGSLFSLWYPRLAKIMMMGPSLGASGALFGVMGCFSYLIPNAEILLFVFPIPGGAWLGFLGSAVWNIAGCVFRWGSFDYAAHLGGSVLGVIYGWYIAQQAEKQREAQMQRLTKWF
ncbi:PCP1 (YGR101W) [Zygosaccharomyces parabailii]|nr:PCP1 (YGR101W) [Zygosaccharomyces parabailii]